MSQKEKGKEWASLLNEVGSKYTTRNIIGKGNAAIVYKAVDEKGESFAVKVYDKDYLCIEYIYNEYLLLTKTENNKRFPKFYGAFRNEKQIWFVLEECECSVKQLLLYLKEKEEIISEKVISFMLYHAAVALNDLHELNFIHRDFKAANILIGKGGEIKLCDFELSIYSDNEESKTVGVVGSPTWMAPEVIASESFPTMAYDARADVWSLGVTAIELGEWEPPLHDVYPPRAIFQIIQHPPPSLKKPADWSQLYSDFIAECLEKTADHRPWLAEILQHPFLTDTVEQEEKFKQKLLTVVSSFKQSTTLTKVEQEATIISDKIRYGGGEERIMYRDDLATLYGVTEGKVIETLRERFDQGRIYTYVGDILILLNPFQDYPLYANETVEKYRCRARCDNAPHIFGISDSAYQDMVHHKQPQNIILTGETGSGKSTAARHILHHITTLTASNRRMAERLVRVQVLMEAFTNAATIFNSNATRHTQLYELTYTKTGKLSGAVLWSYCLEKWRVTHAYKSTIKESNFHIFYYLLHSLIARNEMDMYYLKEMKFTYLPPCSYHTPENSVRKLYEVREAFNAIGIHIDDQETITKILVAVLLIGEIRFSNKAEGEGTRVDDFPELKKVATLLGINPKRLAWALTNYCVDIGGGVIRCRANQEETENIRDGFARGLYTRVVDWIVNLINFKLSLTRLVFGDQQSLGILDIPGFQCFIESNTFDQFCINMVNEQLHFVYNQRIFLHEMEEDNEIDNDNVYNIHDNKSLMDSVLSKPKGFLHFLDIATKSSSKEASPFLKNVKNELQTKFIRVTGDASFIVTHYSGKVNYSVQNFLKRNRNFLSAELIEVMRQSSEPSIVEIFTNKFTALGNLTITSHKLEGISKHWASAMKSNHKKYNTESSGKYSQSRQMRTNAEIMRNSLLQLLQKLSRGSTHFVRCIRSNLKSEPNVFDSSLVKYQIRALGIVNAVRIRQNGYSRRLEFAEFLQRYKFLAFDHDEVVEPTRDNCRLLLIRLKLEGWALGNTKVLLKYYNEEFLSRLYEEQVNQVIKVQSLMRAFLARRKFNIKRIEKRQDSLPENVFTTENVNVNLQAVGELLHPLRATANQSPSSEIVEIETVHSAREIAKKFELQKHTFTAQPPSGRCIPPLFEPKNPELKKQPLFKPIIPLPSSSLLPSKPVKPTSLKIGTPLGEIMQAVSSQSIIPNNQESGSGDDGPFNFKALLKKTNRNLITEEPKQRDLVTQVVTIPTPTNTRQFLQPKQAKIENRCQENQRQPEIRNGNNTVSVMLSPGIVVTGFVEEL